MHPHKAQRVPEQKAEAGIFLCLCADRGDLGDGGKEFVSNDKNTEKSSTTMITNSSNTSSAGSHEKVTIQSSKLPETTESNVQGQSAVEEKSFNTDQVSTSTNSGSQTLQEDGEETPIIVPSIMSVLLSILGIVYKVKSRGL